MNHRNLNKQKLSFLIKNNLYPNRMFKNRRGLGAPVGNLIILMAAVILSTTVVLFATNVTSSQVQKEKLYIATSHVWYVNSTTSIAAVGICDTGPTDIVISQLNVKGLQCEWNGQTNYVLYCKINGTLPGDLPYVSVENLNRESNTTIPIGGDTYDFVLATEGLTIKSGQSLAFYA
ncbi:MAG: hypothetical protein GX638_15975, partial [Crenarchaeota archaeon]|nr:hypothetical protein [Thermoproteota archaeon]